jgi:hypothetical protein
MKVRFQPSQIQMLPSNSKLFSWETYDEDVSSLAESSKITASGLLEQLSATRDTSDYLWYITRLVHFPLRFTNRYQINSKFLCSSMQLKSHCFLVFMPQC